MYYAQEHYLYSAACVQSNYAFCQTNSTWTEKNLAEIVNRKPLNIREQRFDQEAMETEERAASLYHVNPERWKAREETRSTLGQQRGERAANRANKPIEPPPMERQQQAKTSSTKRKQK